MKKLDYINFRLEQNYNYILYIYFLENSNSQMSFEDFKIYLRYWIDHLSQQTMQGEFIHPRLIFDQLIKSVVEQYDIQFRITFIFKKDILILIF